MKSAAPGASTSPVEVTNVSTHGFWIFVGERELFLSFRDFPWFKRGVNRCDYRVELPSPHHLYWPELDVDLAVESIEHPEKHPLVSTRSIKARQPTSRARKRRATSKKRSRAARG